MPVCDVCGKDDYYEEDGQFYCTECNTQSQSMVVMELEECDVSQNVFRLLREVGREKKGRVKEKVYVAGRPWTKYEAYQLVLQAQADALISHGAHPTIKEAILRLWAKYLSLLEVAFVSEEIARLVPKDLEGCRMWHRELYRGDMEKPEVNPRGMKRKLKRNDYSRVRRNLKKSRLDQSKESESLAAALEGETFYEGDNPLDAMDGSGEDSDSDSLLQVDTDSSSNDSDRDTGHGDKGMSCNFLHSTPKPKEPVRSRSRTAIFESVEHMNLAKTLVFCYLGCVFTSNWISVSHILRWAKDASLPYLETTKFLQEDMKMSAYDHRMFKATPMTSEMLRYEAGRLLRFLGFEKIPEFPVKSLSMSYALALDLPESLLPMVARLTRHFPVELPYRRSIGAHQPRALPNVDAACAAYILVALKRLFGLDDHRERLLSDYTQEVQARVSKGIKLFDWRAWKKHISCRFLSGLCFQDDHLENQQEMTQVDRLCQAFDAAGYRDQVFSHSKLYTISKGKKVAAFQQENRDALKHSSELLLERWKNRDATARRIRAEESLGGREASIPSTSAGDFRTHSLEHIFHPEEFLQSYLSPTSSLGVFSAAHSTQSPLKTPSKACTNASVSNANLRHPFLSVGLQSPPLHSGDVRSSFLHSGDVRSSPLRAGGVRSLLPCGDVRSSPHNSGDVRSSPLRAGGVRSLLPCGDVRSSPLHSGGVRSSPMSVCSGSDREETSGRVAPVVAGDGDARDVGETVSALLKMHASTRGRYLMYPSLLAREYQNAEKMRQVRSKQHRSYKWLLKVLSEAVCCPATDIEQMVWVVERLMEKGFS